MSSKTPVEQINNLIQQYAQDVVDARELWDKQMQKRNSIQIQETSSNEISYSEPSHTNLSNSENLTAEKRNLEEDEEIIALTRPKITKGNESFLNKLYIFIYPQKKISRDPNYEPKRNPKIFKVR